MNDILLSVPSIVIGLFVYELLVRQSGHFSGWAGAIALAFILLPVVVRTTVETMRLIPMYLRKSRLPSALRDGGSLPSAARNTWLPLVICLLCLVLVLGLGDVTKPTNRARPTALSIDG